MSLFWANVFFSSILDVLFVGIDLYLIISVYGAVDSAIDKIITSNNRSTLDRNSIRIQPAGYLGDVHIG